MAGNFPLNDQAEDHKTARAREDLNLVDRLRIWPARLVANPKIRSWLARFPLTRPASRHQTQALFDVVAGFVHTQVLLAFVEARLETYLADQPRSLTDIARQADMPPDHADRLMRAACSLGLAQLLSKDRYYLGLKGAALIDNPGVVAMIKHHAKLYRDLEDPLALLRGEKADTEIAAYWAYLRPDLDTPMADQDVSAYSNLMAVSQTMITETITASFDFSKYQRVMDVGGGTGTFLMHLAGTTANVNLTLFDLPQVADQAKERLARERLDNRITATGGNFKTGGLPKGHDLITLVRVAYDHDDETVLDLLSACRRALSPGGTLMIAEPFAGSRSSDRTANAYFGFYLLAMGSGRTRTFEEHKQLLSQAGFSNVRSYSTVNPGLVRILLATA